MDNISNNALRRQNFVRKATEKFDFLCSDFGYIGPEHCFDEQHNGSVISEKLTYVNTSIDRQIVFYNGYHPVDYGFELQFFRPSVTTQFSEREMVYYRSKEKQDDDQSYLDEVVTLLNDDLYPVISGKTWITND